MSRRWGVALLAIGALLVLSGVVVAVNGGGDDGLDATETSAAATDPPTTETPAISMPDNAAPETAIEVPTSTTPVTTALPETTAVPATTIAPTTTSIAAPVTTTTAPPVAAPLVEEFVATYAAAIASGDEAFLFDSLLPDVVDVLGADLCRGWIGREILTLAGYRLTGEVGAASQRTLRLGDDTIELDRYVEAPVSFTFQGQLFDSIAAFAVTDEVVNWIGECR